MPPPKSQNQRQFRKRYFTLYQKFFDNRSSSSSHPRGSDGQSNFGERCGSEQRREAGQWFDGDDGAPLSIPHFVPKEVDRHREQKISITTRADFLPDVARSRLHR
jgi:hypothetical protein